MVKKHFSLGKLTILIPLEILSHGPRLNWLITDQSSDHVAEAPPNGRERHWIYIYNYIYISICYPYKCEYTYCIYRLYPYYTTKLSYSQLYIYKISFNLHSPHLVPLANSPARNSGSSEVRDLRRDGGHEAGLGGQSHEGTG